MNSLLKPNRTHFSLLSSSLLRLTSEIWTYPIHPKILKCSTDDFLSLHASSRVISFTMSVGDLLRMWFTNCTASGQKAFDTSFSNNAALTMFMIVRFLRSATPFCWGVKAVVSYLLIPCALQNSLNAIELYSPPLSVLRHLMNNPVCFSTNTLNALNWWNVSDFSSTKYIHVFLEKSSIKLIKYPIWLSDGSIQRSEWINCNLLVAHGFN